MARMKKHPFLVVEWQATVKFSEAERRKLNRWLDLAGLALAQLQKEGVVPGTITNYSVSLLICGDKRIQDLNRDHRGKDMVTDVLSFPAADGLRKNKKLQGPVFLGDLAICLPQARRQAREFKIDLWDEFIHLFFHGLLHLMGYDHELSAKDEKLMQAWEDRALTIFSHKKKGS